MSIKFWGVRGSCPGTYYNNVKYGGNTCCVSIELDDVIFILDAGTGIRQLGETLRNTSKPIVLFLTHLHWDHIQGLPFFAPLYEKREIQIYGPPDTQYLHLLLDQFDQIRFPIHREMLLASFVPIDSFHTIESLYKVNVQSIRVNHPGVCYGYRFDIANKSIVFIPDNQIHETENNCTSFSELIHFCKDADILIHDAQYTKQDMPEKIDWGHSVVEDTVTLAKESHVKELFLFHHDPNRNDSEIDQIVQDVRLSIQKSRIELRCSAASEGLSIQ